MTESSIIFAALCVSNLVAIGILWKMERELSQTRAAAQLYKAHFEATFVSLSHAFDEIEQLTNDKNKTSV